MTKEQEEKLDRGPEPLADPFPGQSLKKDEPSESGSRAIGKTERAAELIKEDILELCSDAADGFHSFVQLAKPRVTDMAEKPHKRITKALYKNLTAAGVKEVSPLLSLGVALAAGYGPKLKEMRAEPKQLGPKQETAPPLSETPKDSAAPVTLTDVLTNGKDKVLHVKPMMPGEKRDVILSIGDLGKI